MSSSVLFLGITVVISFQFLDGARVSPERNSDGGVGGVANGGVGGGASSFEDLPILVPDIGIVNSANLTDAKAEKFLKLWQLFVLSGKVVLSDEPWTLLVPLNEGLPRDSSFLIDKDYTRNVILNHVILGDVINMDSVTSHVNPFYSLADSQLSFKKNEKGDVLVNDVRLTGTEVRFDNGVIYVIEKSIPLTQPEFLKFVSSTDKAPRSGPKVSQILKFVTKSEGVDVAKNVVEVPKYVVEDTSKTITSDANQLTGSSGSSSRPTRFDKFRNRKSHNGGQVPASTTSNLTAESTTQSTVMKSMEISLALSSQSSSSSSSSSSLTVEVTAAHPAISTAADPAISISTAADPEISVSTAADPEILVSTAADPEISVSTAADPAISVSPSGNLNLNDEMMFKEDSTTPENQKESAAFPNTETETETIHTDDIEVFDMFDNGEFAELVQSDPSTTFVESMLRELNDTNSMGWEFFQHFLEADLGKFLSPDKNYTAIIPTNDAFYDYYPIDWGFNPFLVQNFTKDVLLNHILEGDIHLQQFHDDVEIHTLAGRVVKVIKDRVGTLLVNGVVMPIETETEVNSGRIYYIHQLLFVDYDRVNALRVEYPFLETAPLLSFPWPSSPFLSHLLKRLQEGTSAKIFAHLLRNSDISHLVHSTDENLTRLTYTAFVPTDSALKESFGMENLAVLDRKSIDDFLLEHIVPGYLLEEDFEDGFNLLSLTNTPLPIRIKDANIYVGPAKLDRPQQYVYNLGAIFFTDKSFHDIAFEKPVNMISDSMADKVAMIPLNNLHAEDIKENPLNHLATNLGNSLTPSEVLAEVDTSPTNTPKPSDVTNQWSVVTDQKSDVTVQSSDVTNQPEIIYEVRTEISFSRQINDGEIVPVSRDVIERAKSL